MLGYRSLREEHSRLTKIVAACEERFAVELVANPVIVQYKPAFRDMPKLQRDAIIAKDFQMVREISSGRFDEESSMKKYDNMDLMSNPYDNIYNELRKEAIAMRMAEYEKERARIAGGSSSDGESAAQYTDASSLGDSCTDKSFTHGPSDDSQFQLIYVDGHRVLSDVADVEDSLVSSVQAPAQELEGTGLRIGGDIEADGGVLAAPNSEVEHAATPSVCVRHAHSRTVPPPQHY